MEITKIGTKKKMECGFKPALQHFTGGEPASHAWQAHQVGRTRSGQQYERGEKQHFSHGRLLFRLRFQIFIASRALGPLPRYVLDFRCCEITDDFVFADLIHHNLVRLMRF